MLGKRRWRMSLNTEQEQVSAFLTYLQMERQASSYTVANYAKDIEHFFAFFSEQGRETPLDQISYTDIRQYLRSLNENEYARKSVARKLSALRSFWNFLQREHAVRDNPFRFVSTPKAEQRLPVFFYEDEMRAVIEGIDQTTDLGKRNLAIVELLYAAGIRVSELTGITVEDLDLAIGTLLVSGKGRKERYVPVGSFALDALENYLESARPNLASKAAEQNDQLFLNYRGGPLTDRGVRKVLNAAVEDAALKSRISPHVIRHTFATHMLNEGADLRTVQELLGHKGLSATQIYTHVTKDRLREVYRNSHPRA